MEAIVAGQKSAAVQLSSLPGRNPGAMWEIVFSGDPGVFEIDIEDAANDTDNAYILNLSNAAFKITAVGKVGTDGKRYIYVELQPVGAVFQRLNMVALTNVVNVQAKVVYV
jgi:hypothetical protein